MNILYIGDIMGDMGMAAVERELPQLRAERDLDLVVAQAENVSEGKGITLEDFNRVQAAGVNFCTGGNWTLARDEIFQALDDPDEPIIRPANYPQDTPGLGYKYVETAKGKVLLISLMGQIVGRDADKPVDNPLKVVDRILAEETADKRTATVVNLHGDFSSEKYVFGYYLDGRVSVVVGDHWHVPTADADILPRGTAHMTDVGMCGSVDSSLGVTLESVIPRWRDGIQTRNILAEGGRNQFNALFVSTDDRTGKATAVEHIRRIFE
jgi:metallophosphoesterase (TIGR00282 family)